ncbi:MAG: hypothetical protein ACREVK_09175 [Gammaproteobacteria bacterium]
MIKIKNTLLGCALTVALSVAPATTADFYALAGLRGTTPAPLPDEVLAATEGGAVCTVAFGLLSVTADSGTAGGVCLVSILITPTGGLAIFAVANALPVLAANFLQVTTF